MLTLKYLMQLQKFMQNGQEEAVNGAWLQPVFSRPPLVAQLIKMLLHV